MKREIALQMWTMREFMNDPVQLDETLRRVAEVGYKYVQIRTPAFMTVQTMQEMLEKHGLKADTAFGASMKIRETLPEILEEARIFGVDVVRLDGMPGDLAKTEEGFHKYAKILNEGGRLLRENGLRMYYHFHAFEFCRFESGVRGIDILLNETEAENVWFQPDVFWLAAAGTEPSVSLNMFKGRVAFMHVKDFAIRPRSGIMEAQEWATVPVGEGNLNWPGIVRTADELGIYRYVVEIEEGDPFYCMEAAYKNLKAMGME